MKNNESNEKPKNKRYVFRFFKSMTARMLGLYSLRQGNKFILHAWRGLTHPICPECSEGYLTGSKTAVKEEINGKQELQYAWTCSNCGFSLLATDQKQAYRIASNFRYAKVKETLSRIDFDKRQSIARNHQMQSRIYYIASLLCLCGMLFYLYNDTSIMVVINWAAFATMMFVFGLKKSYRYWQITTGTIYSKGSFSLWFKNGKWIV